jgi:hypothetical protein
VDASRTALAWARTSLAPSEGTLERMLPSLWYEQRILRLFSKSPSMALRSPGAPSEVTEIGVLKPRLSMSLKNSTQHASVSLLPTARCNNTLCPSVVMHQAARTPSFGP